MQNPTPLFELPAIGQMTELLFLNLSETYLLHWKDAVDYASLNRASSFGDRRPSKWS